MALNINIGVSGSNLAGVDSNIRRAQRQRFLEGLGNFRTEETALNEAEEVVVSGQRGGVPFLPQPITSNRGGAFGFQRIDREPAARRQVATGKGELAQGFYWGISSEDGNQGLIEIFCGDMSQSVLFETAFLNGKHNDSENESRIIFYPSKTDYCNPNFSGAKAVEFFYKGNIDITSDTFEGNFLFPVGGDICLFYHQSSQISASISIEETSGRRWTEIKYYGEEATEYYCSGPVAYRDYIEDHEVKSETLNSYQRTVRKLFLLGRDFIRELTPPAQFVEKLAPYCLDFEGLAPSYQPGTFTLVEGEWTSDPGTSPSFSAYPTPWSQFQLCGSGLSPSDIPGGLGLPLGGTLATLYDRSETLNPGPLLTCSYNSGTEPVCQLTYPAIDYDNRWYNSSTCPTTIFNPAPEKDIRRQLLHYINRINWNDSYQYTRGNLTRNPEIPNLFDNWNYIYEDPERSTLIQLGNASYNITLVTASIFTVVNNPNVILGPGDTKEEVLAEFYSTANTPNYSLYTIVDPDDDNLYTVGRSNTLTYPFEPSQVTTEGPRLSRNKYFFDKPPPSENHYEISGFLGTVFQAWDWGQPSYCRQQLSNWGFSPGDLTR